MKGRSYRLARMTLVLVSAFLFSACPFRKQAPPPGGLTYSSNPANYIKQQGITPNIPTSTGGFVTSYAVTPALPTGLRLDTKTGIITGTPTTITPSFIYTVTASNNHGTTGVDLHISIDDTPPLISYTPNPNIVQIGSPISLSPTNLGGPALSYSVTPPLPTGLTLDLATGVISGTPTVVTSPAVYTITAINTGGPNQFLLTLGVKGPFWMVDGNFGGVSSMLTLNNALYLGGTFRFIGPYRGHGGILDRLDGSMPLGVNYPLVNGVINSVVADPNVAGAYYIGGNFTMVGTTSISHLAHILANGNVDTSFNVAPTGPVTALHMNSPTLYVAGTFTNIGGANRAGLASFDITSGLPNGFMGGVGQTGPTGGTIKAMVFRSPNLYLGGTFTNFNGVGCTSLWAVDGASGANLTPTTWSPSVTGGAVSVDAMAVSGSDIIVGGSFTNVTGPQKLNLAALTASAPATLTVATPDITKTPGAAQIYALAVDGGKIYLGGDFDDVGGGPRNGVAAIDASTGALDILFVPEATGTVRSIVVNSPSVYLGGNFRKMQNLFRSNFAIVADTDGAPNTVNPGFADRVNSIALNAGRMFVGGDFGSFSMTPRNNAASIDPQTGQALSWNPDVDDSVYAMVASGNNIYLGGKFGTIAGNPTAFNGLAIVDGQGNLNTTWRPSLDNATEVRALALNGTSMYVGGSFANMGSNGQNIDNLALVDATPANPGTSSTLFRPQPDDPVNALSLVGNALYVGGEFQNIGNPVQGIRHAAQIDASASSAGLAATWAPDPDGFIRAILTRTTNNITTIYIAGDFGSLKGGLEDIDGVASVATNGNINTGFNANMTGGAGYSLALNTSGTELFVGGTFQQLGLQPRNGLGGVNTTNGNADLVFNPGLLRRDVRSIFLFGSNTIFFGGDFSAIQNGSKYTTGFGAVTLSGSPLR